MTPPPNRPLKPAADAPPAPPRRPHHIHLSRRSFIAGAALIGAGAAATAVFRLNDGDKTDSEVAGTEATPRSNIAKSPATSRGGILRTYNFDAMPYDSIDPHLTMMGPIANMHAAVFSRLLRYDDEVAGSIVPDLAVAMPEQPDDTTYVFQIRDGIRFHDTQKFRTAFPATAGRLLTADDIRLSIERQMDRTSPQARRMFRRGNWEVIDRIEVPDARTLIVRTREPIAPMLSFFAGRHAFVIPNEVLDRSDQITSPDASIGTGPFVLDSIEDRVAMRLRRNPQWFARDDDPTTGTARPYLDGYDAFFSPQEDVFQRFTFDRSTIDMTGFVDQGELGRAHAANLDDIGIEQIDAGGVLAMRLLLDRPPFLDDRARRALHLALDRTALTNLLFPVVDGAPSARPSAAIPPGVKRWALDSETVASKPGFRSDTEGRAQDLREAKQLWDAALGSAPIDLRIFFAGIPRTIPERAVEAIRTQLRGALGVNLISQVDPSGNALLANAFMRNLDGATEGAITCTFAFEDSGVDLDDCLYPHFRSGEAMNTYRLQDPQLDSLLDQQRREFDTSTRRQIGLDAQEYLLANVNARIEICAPVERRLVWGYVRNSRMPLWHGSTQDLADVWLDKSHPAFASRPA